MEQTGAGTRPQGSLVLLLWEFQACLAEGHSLRVGSAGWHLTLPTPGSDQVALQGWNLVPLGLVPPAVLLTPSSLKH